VHIVHYPHPTLRHESKPLRRVDAELRRIVGQMRELMYEHRGIGLAANQVDLPYRLFVLNISGDPEQKDLERVFINPVISRRGGGMAEAEEGCLSLPGIYAPVRRSARCVLSAYNLQGEEVHLKLDGLFARAAQHECDHLDGTVFIDRLSDAARASVRDEIAALEAEFEGKLQRGAVPDEQAIAERLGELEALRT
jgi:peptide deformylase